MPVVSSEKNIEQLTLSFVAEFRQERSRVWQLWSDARQLERWWGPPSWPATFRSHDFVEGGGCSYHMTGPDGEIANGWWKFRAIEEPNRIEFEDGFSDDSGEPDPTMPKIRGTVELESIAAGTRLTVVSSFASPEQMEQLSAMGMEEGMRQAMGQMDSILFD